MRTAFWLAAVLLFGACDSPADVDDRWARPEQIQFASSLNVDLASMTKTSSGLYWKDLRTGQGDSAQVGPEVRIDFTVWLPDGTVIGRDTAQFMLGLGLMVRGIDEGVVGMQVGGVRQLVLRPELAFGRNGRPELGIPPLTTLVYEVERIPTIAH